MQTASTEHFFTRVSRRLQREAERQHSLVYATAANNNDNAAVTITATPSNLITVHLRWGDKKGEMELVGVERYVEVVETTLTRQTGMNHHTSENTSVSVFLSTGDKFGVAAFAKAAPDHWRI